MANNRWEYTVTGRLELPFDMLRYDAAWPADSEAASLASSSYGDRFGHAPAAKPGEIRQLAPIRTIRLLSVHGPTVERWKSFGWRVENVRSYKV